MRLAGRSQGNNTLSSVSAHRNTDGTYSGTMALKNDGASVSTPPMCGWSASCTREHNCSMQVPAEASAGASDLAPE